MRNLILLVIVVAICLLYSCQDDPVDVDMTLEKFQGTWLEVYPCDSIGIECLTLIFTTQNTVLVESSTNTEFNVEYIDYNTIKIIGYDKQIYEYQFDADNTNLVIFEFYTSPWDLKTLDYHFVKQ